MAGPFQPGPLKNTPAKTAEEEGGGRSGVAGVEALTACGGGERGEGQVGGGKLIMWLRLIR